MTHPEGSLGSSALADANGRLQNWVLQNPAVTAGFNSIAFVGPDTLDLRWKGQLPSALGPVLDELKTSGVTVRPVEVPWSRQEILDAVQVMLKLTSSEDVNFYMVGPNSDGDGIKAVVNASPASSNRAAIEDSLKAAAGDIPVTVVFEEHTTKLASIDRRHDTEPFWGGAAVTSLTDGRSCTTLAPARKPDGTTGLIAARHCGRNQLYETYDDGLGGNDVGTAGGGVVSTDSVFIKGKIVGWQDFTGAWNSSDFNPLVPGADPGLGDEVCSNGAFSGRICDGPLMVMAVDQFTTLDDGSNVGPGFWFSNRNRDGMQAHAALGDGDSGGAVFSWANSNRQIQSNGMAVKIRTDEYTSCPGSPDLVRFCSPDGFAINISAVNNSLDTHLITTVLPSP
ncbi:hypothetical protein GCM10022242_00040 [Nocardioides panacisoli]|uniref:Peptidase S1 domain-containing protein n=2 Tax=Nocardioides panacisoli TaxID=627624 RepID=A0ABP7HSC1_9ACTN